MNTPDGEMVSYGSERVPREKFLSWQQIRDISQSGLVELASHSFNLHKGLLADAVGDMLPATITHGYNPTTDTYESDKEMVLRIADDLKRNNKLIADKTGSSPRVMVWPFGRYNQLAIDAAKTVGMDLTLTLDPVSANTDSLSNIARAYPTLNPETGSFQYSFLAPGRPPLRRFVHVEIDELLESDQEETHFNTFLERMKSLSPGRVYFEPALMVDGEFKAMFRNKFIPSIQDRLIRLTWHTNRRAGTEVHLTLSELMFQAVTPKDYTSFFKDMGRSAPCSGILLANSTILPNLLNDLRGKQFTEESPIWNPNITRKRRVQLLRDTGSPPIKHIVEALEAFQYWQPFLDVGLLIPAHIYETAGEKTLHNILRYFDYIMVDYRDEPLDLQPIKKVTEYQSTHKLQHYTPILVKYETTKKLLSQFKQLQKAGIVDYGYSYDDFKNNSPDRKKIIPALSTRTYPFIAK